MAKHSLKVGIYPYIPDLNGDNLSGLKEFIKREFEQQHPDIELNLFTNWDPYDVDKVTSNLTSKADSFDILEIDTILLGEVVDKGVVQRVDLKKFDLENEFFPVAVDAVTHRGRCYGIPTLNCANFLMELISGDVPDANSEILCTLEMGIHSVEDLKKVVRRYHSLFKGVSPLVGNFRGKWTLPLLFVDAFVDKHGRDSVDDAVDAAIDDPDNADVLDNMKWFMGLDEGTDGRNKGESGDYHDGTNKAIDKDVAASDHIMMYGYSEWLSQVMADRMCKKKHIHASCIVAPPLGKENNLLTFTDALVINNSRFAEPWRCDAITKFVKFYNSLHFRNLYAEGRDLKEPHPPRYVIISRKDFYTEGFGGKNKNYHKFRDALQFAVAAPNFGIDGRHKEMNKMLVDKLHLPPTP